MRNWWLYLAMGALAFLPVEQAQAQAADTVYITVIDTVVTVVIPQPDSTLAVGETYQLTAIVTDGAGNPSNAAVVWTASDLAVLTVNQDGLVTMVGQGQGFITAAVLPRPPPGGGGAIPVSITRLDGGSGEALVEAGFPLQPGALFPGQENIVSLWREGVEQPVFTRALRGLHPDGSLRAVFVQTIQDFSGQVDATIRIGEPRSSSMAEVPRFTKIRFRSGGPARIEVGDQVRGALSGATATVGRFALKYNNGTHWDQGTNEGYLYLDDQVGAFRAEDLDVPGKQSNIATVSGDSNPTVVLVGRQAILYPTSAEYLVGWNSLGPLVVDTGGVDHFGQWLVDYDLYMGQNYESRPWVWGQSGDTFYDRVFNHLQRWSISGDATWLLAAIEYANWVHDEADKSYQQIYYQEPTGKLPIYWLTGAEEYADQTSLMAERMPGSYAAPERFIAQDPGVNELTEGRSMAKFALHALNAWMYGHDSQEWSLEPAKWIEANEVHQAADGSFSLAWAHFAQPKQLNYMAGMRVSALILMYDWFSGEFTPSESQRIEDIVVAWTDFLWESPDNPQWFEPTMSMFYAADPNNHIYNTPPEETPGLNGLILDGSAFSFQVTGQEKYRTNTNRMFESLATRLDAGKWTWFPKNSNQISFGPFNARARLMTVH